MRTVALVAVVGALVVRGRWGADAHPVYVGGEDNGVEILSHANTDFKAVAGSSAGGKVRSYLDFEAHGDLDAKGALTYQGKDVATVDKVEELEAVVATLREDLNAEQAVVATLREDLGAEQAVVATLREDLGAEQAVVATLRGDLTVAQANVATLQGDVKSLKANVLPTCDGRGTQGLEYSSSRGGWVCSCRGGWVGDYCEGGAAHRSFANKNELVVAVKKCAEEHTACLFCPGMEAVYGPFAEWDVSAITDMSELFSGMQYFDGNVSAWEVSQVTNMRYMFASAGAFNQDLSDWKTGKVADMTKMFQRAYTFNQNISSWDTSSVSAMDAMMERTSSFWQDISAWILAENPSTTYMWHYSRVADNYASCSHSSPPSCTDGITG